MDSQIRVDERWMSEALKLAQQAQDAGEVPVGAVIVKQNQIISSGYNHPIESHDPSAHAEMVALRNAGTHLNNYRLLDTTLYVTLEPCIMCAGAMIHARIKRLVYGARDPKTGSAGGRVDIFAGGLFNHEIEVTADILGDQCGDLLRNFFKQKRRLNQV